MLLINGLFMIVINLVLVLGLWNHWFKFKTFASHIIMLFVISYTQSISVVNTIVILKASLSSKSARQSVSVIVT